MSSNDIHGIEKGWTVKTADGSSIGTVEETTDTYIEVKSGLINSTHRYLPAAVLEHVRPEVSEIGIDLTQDQVEQGDWSQPPLEPPRASGAPLNAEEYSDDNALNGEVREPERPVKY